MSFPIPETSWIDALPATIHDELLTAMTPMHLHKGEMIYQQGEPSHALYHIRQGEVAISYITAEGKELILGLVESSGCFGEMGLIDGAPRDNTACAKVDTELLVLAEKDFLRLRKKHPEITEQLLVFVAHRARLTFNELSSHTLMTIPQQLALRLTHLADHYFEPTSDGYKITLKLSREDLSKSLGVTRQSIHSAINTLINEELIHFESGFIVIHDKPSLKNFAHST